MTAAATAPLPPTDGSRFVNRELSWLEFNARVLALAEDQARPLLERAKFLAIFSQNLDEFFEVRVSGLEEQLLAGVRGTSPDGLDPAAQLRALRSQTDDLVQRQAAIFTKDIAPALEEAGIRFADWAELDDADRAELGKVFDERVFPVLTPLAVDPAHPFPYISNLSLNLAVLVRDPTTGEDRFARVKVPPLLPRFIPLADGERFLPLEQLIAARLDLLFPGMDVVGQHPFRVTRDADFDLEDEDEDLLEAIESVLHRRSKFGRVVRLEIDTTMSPEARELLCRELEIADAAVNVDRRAARPVRPLGPLRPRPSRAEGRPVDTADPAGAGPRRRERRLLPDPAAGRRAGAPPVRLVRDVGRGLHRPGRVRSAGARDQADDLPHRGHRQRDRALARQSGQGRQAGRRAGRAQSALRRAGEHRPGPRARRGRRAHRVRPRGPEDPREDHARRPPGGRRHPPLLPRRHRQLQPEDRRAVRGHRPAVREPRPRCRPHAALQPPHRVQPADALPQAPRGARSRSDPRSPSGSGARARRAPRGAS